MKKKSVYVDYIGCEKRKLDAQRILNFFLANGYLIIDNPLNADIIVYITCAFNKQYEDWSIDNIQKLQKTRINGKEFIIGGCLTEISPTRLKNLTNIKMLTVRNLDMIDDLIKPTVSIKKIPDPNTTIFEDIQYKTRIIDEFTTAARREYEKAKKGYKIRINYGCLGNCSYCVTKFATKSLKSKPLLTILNEFQNAIKRQRKTILFTGGDTGAYGQDNSLTIVDLLLSVLKFRGDYRLYFHDFGVHWLIKYFDDLFPIFTKYRKNFGIFNFPIQSGNNKILKLMHRPYKIENVISCLKKLKIKLPEIKFGTHLLVGFPNELEDDFQKSINLINEIPFDFLMVFEYSDNPLADSFKLSGKINESTIKNRYNILRSKFYKNYNKRKNN